MPTSSCKWCHWPEEENKTSWYEDEVKQWKLKRNLEWYEARHPCLESEVKQLKCNIDWLHECLQWYKDEVKQLQWSLSWYEADHTRLQNELKQLQMSLEWTSSSSCSPTKEAAAIGGGSCAPFPLLAEPAAGASAQSVPLQSQWSSSSCLSFAEASGDPPQCNSHGRGVVATDLQVNKYTESNEAPWQFDGFLWSINLPSIGAISKANLHNGPGFIRSHRVGKNRSGAKFLDSHLAIMCPQCKEAVIIDFFENHVEDSRVLEDVDQKLLNWFKIEKPVPRRRCTLETACPGSCVIGGGTS